MLSKEKKAEVVAKFLNSYYKILACGIEFEEDKCDGKKFFFTWPEMVSEDCCLIDCSKFDDNNCKDMLCKLVKNPKTTCVDAVKNFVVCTTILGWIEDPDSDDFEVDLWYDDVEMSREMIPIKLFAKPRKGIVWTACLANNTISNASIQIEKVIQKYTGYSEV